MGITRTLNNLGKMLAKNKPADEKIKYVCWGCGREYQRKSPTYPICGDCGAEIWTRQEILDWSGGDGDIDESDEEQP